MTPMNFNAQQCSCYYIGSIQCNSKHVKQFENKEIWQRIVDEMNIGVNCSDVNQTPQFSRLSQVTEDMSTLLYESVINSVYPNEKLQKEKIYNEVSSYKISIDRDIQLIKNDKNSIVHVEDIRLYTFPFDIMLFSINIIWKDNTSFDTITHHGAIIRQIEHYKDNNVAEEFVSLYIPILKLYNEANRGAEIYINDVAKLYLILHKVNKLKSYIIAQTDHETESRFSNEYSIDHLLYDVATLSPIGAAIDSESAISPSKNYFNNLINNNKIDCFNSWQALSLVDTFCCILNSHTSSFHFNTQWRIWYFEYLYLNVLYLKTFMLDMLDKFNTHSHSKKVFESVRAVDKIFNHYNVSYNFLPDITYRKMREGMEIEDELNAIKNQIEAYENYDEQRRERKLNKLVVWLTVITAIACFNDIWEIALKICKLLN